MKKWSYMFLPFILTLLVWISAAEVNAAEESVISVNDGNWIEYFNEDGTIKDSYPDGVVFALEGEFHNREFIINKPASLITADTQGILTDCSVSIRSANVTVNGLYISLSGEEAGRNVIEIIDADNVTISNNTISIDKEDAKKNGYPINASNTNNLKISNNTIIYDAIIQSGNENDYNIDRGLMITGTADTYLTGIEVTDNNFNLNLPFRENAITPSAGVELSYCKGAVFNSNKVTVTSIGNVGYSPVLDAVLVTNCIDGAVKNNLIRTTGYGITVSKNAATVTGNDVKTTADYAVNVTDTASEVTDNILMAKSADGDDAVYAENQAAIVRDNLAKSTMIAKQPENLKLEYGYASGPVLSVKIKSNLYSEVTYQWFQCSDSSGTDPQKITNATEAYFAVPQGLKAGKSYYYCRLTGKNAGEDPAVEDTNIIEVSVLAKTVSNPVIELTENEFVYDKTAKKPAVTVRDGNTLIPTEEYTVSYSSNINAGKEAVISITDQEGGNYVVNGNQTFTILPKEVGLVWTDTSFTYDGKPHVPAATVTGIIEGDTCTVKVTGKQTESSATPYTATAVSLSNLNYALPTKNTVSFKILKAKKSSPTGNTEASNKNAAIQKAETADKQSVKNLEQTIFAQKNDKEPKNSSFSGLKAKAGSVKKNAITVSWIKNKNAEGYLIYGNLAGKKKAMVKLGQTGKTRFTVKKILSKKLGKGTGYKFTVVSYNTSGGYRKVLSVSKTVFSCTLGGKNTNVKKITLKAKSASVKKGKKYRIIVKTVKADKKLKLKTFRKLNFESSNKKIATVSAKGVVKGIRKGKVTIYVYAQNGIYATIKIKVK